MFMNTQSQLTSGKSSGVKNSLIGKKGIIFATAFAVLLILGLSVYIYIYHKQNGNSMNVSDTSSTARVSVTASQSPAVTTNTSPTFSATTVPVSTVPTGVVTASNGIQTYAGRGISFQVVQTFSGSAVIVKDFGNRTYVYTGSFSQYNPFVEVFSKNRTDSITQAITKSVLSNYQNIDCPITIQKALLNQPQSDQTAWITYASNNKREDGSAKDPSKCPADYTRTNGGLMYFMVDTTHPDKLIFFAIGGGTYPANTTPNSPSWFENLKVDS